MALTANKVLVSDNNGDIAASSTDSSKLPYISSLTSNAEQTGNKVTSLSSSNTDTQYPSAKAVYDEIVPNVTASYTAVSGKGGTLPATQNLANLATSINSIPSGGSGYSELPSYQVSNGVARRKSVVLTGHEFDGITRIDDNGFDHSFIYCNLRGNLNFSSVITVGSFGLYYAFSYCGISNVDLSSLTTLLDSAMQFCFENCSNLATVNFSSLTNLDADGVLRYAFGDCWNITDIYFNALTTTSFGSYSNQFRNMFNSSSGEMSGAITMHFPSNLSSTISGLTGYPNFGATAGMLTLAFDLPATS